jgi:hypothetical protein
MDHGDLSLLRCRFHLAATALLRMPAYNKGSTVRLTPKGNVIRGGFGSTFACLPCRHRQGGLCVMRILKAVFVIVLVAERMNGGGRV